jgi:hypothetical protein
VARTRSRKWTRRVIAHTAMRARTSRLGSTPGRHIAVSTPVRDRSRRLTVDSPFEPPGRLECPPALVESRDGVGFRERTVASALTRVRVGGPTRRRRARRRLVPRTDRPRRKDARVTAREAVIPSDSGVRPSLSAETSGDLNADYLRWRPT